MRLGLRRTVAAGFLQATSLPFIVASVAIGEKLGALSPATGAALIAAGLVSVLVFPAVALAVLRAAPAEHPAPPASEPTASEPTASEPTAPAPERAPGPTPR